MLICNVQSCCVSASNSIYCNTVITLTAARARVQTQAGRVVISKSTGMESMHVHVLITGIHGEEFVQWVGRLLLRPFRDCEACIYQT